MENAKETMDNLAEMAKALPVEKQIQLMWAMIGALATNIDNQRKFYEAGLTAIQQFVEKCANVEEKTMVARDKLTKEIMLAFFEASAEKPQE